MFKSILAHVTGSDRDRSVLTTSLRLARTCDGHIDGLHINPDLNAVATQIEQVGMAGWLTLRDRLNRLEQEAKEKKITAQANFEAFCREERIQIAGQPPGPDTISASWIDNTGEEIERLARLSRYCDALVLAGGADRPGRMRTEELGSIVVGSGRPVMLAPATQNTGAFKTIAVAWKDVPEAARAVTAAMPLLKRAERVEVFSANESHSSPDKCENSLERVLRYFRWHGLNVTSHLLATDPMTTTEAVLDSVGRAGVDLLVMGAYGHARLRELVFGGFTQQVLRGLEFPVFMFH